MKRSLAVILAIIVALFIFTASAPPDEGMWLLTQINKLPIPEMRQRGLQLAPEEIYSNNPSDATITQAIVVVGGGTGSFVSSEGLIVTNHHVAFGGIQSVSSVTDDYLKDGFVAKSREEELSLSTYTASFVLHIEDVTEKILSAVSDTMSPATRAKAIKAKIAEVETLATQNGKPGENHKISEKYFGVKYLQYTTRKLSDIRLVYAPPSSIGVFGGEIDNWMWPRHTGDFAILRAYTAPDGKDAKYAKENVPFRPVKFLPISTSPLKEGDFAMILGFPGRTYRYRTAAEVKYSRDEILPLYMKIFTKRMDIIERWGKNNRAIELKYASKWRGMANTHKNFQGTLEGMRRSNVLAQRLQLEQDFQTFLESSPEAKQKYQNALSEITATYRLFESFARKQIVFSQLTTGVDMIRIAQSMRSFAESFEKDASGDLAPKEGSIEATKKALAAVYKDYDINVDRETFAAMLTEAADLPEGQRIEAVQEIVGSAQGEKRTKKIREFVDELYDDSQLISEEEAGELLGESADDIRADPFVEFAAALAPTGAKTTEQMNDFNTRIDVLRGKWLEAMMAWKGEDIYPDANRSLRLTHGTVRPYSPRDAVEYGFATSLSGIMEKETGEEPFIVPEKLRQLWEKKDFGPYADPTLNDIPVAFIAELDITGGNSGSPVINGKGEFIGAAFDGNWEAVVGDYLYQEKLNRTITVDSRYILFLLDKYSNAQNILQELVIRNAP